MKTDPLGVSAHLDWERRPVRPLSGSLHSDLAFCLGPYAQSLPVSWWRLPAEPSCNTWQALFLPAWQWLHLLTARAQLLSTVWTSAAILSSSPRACSAHNNSISNDTPKEDTLHILTQEPSGFLASTEASHPLARGHQGRKKESEWVWWVLLSLTSLPVATHLLGLLLS